MNINNIDNLQLTGCGHQDCSDMHSWGPGIRSNYTIHYIIKGAGYLECNNKKYYIQEGESFLIVPFDIIYYYPDPANPWEYIWVDFQGDIARKHLHLGPMTEQQLICPAIPKEVILPHFEHLCSLDIYTFNRMEACGILLSILGTYADAFPAKQDDTALGEDPRITTALLLIRSHYHRSYFNVAKLCQLMHCNRVTLHRLFQSELGESPGNYLSAFRIRQACTMLKMGMSVKTTALSCGFEDPFYFSRVFKQQKGCSPSDYKQLHVKS